MNVTGASPAVEAVIGKVPSCVVPNVTKTEAVPVLSVVTVTLGTTVGVPVESDNVAPLLRVKRTLIPAMPWPFASVTAAENTTLDAAAAFVPSPAVFVRDAGVCLTVKVAAAPGRIG